MFLLRKQMSVRLYNVCAQVYRLQTGNMLSDFFKFILWGLSRWIKHVLITFIPQLFPPSNSPNKVCVLLFRKKLTHWFQLALPIFVWVYGPLLPHTTLLKMPVSAFPSHHQLWIAPELGVGVPVCYPSMLGCLLVWPCGPWVHKCNDPATPGRHCFSRHP